MRYRAYPVKRGRSSWRKRQRWARREVHPLHGKAQPERRSAYWLLRDAKKKLREQMKQEHGETLLALLDAVQIIVHAQNLLLDELEAHERDRLGR